LHHLLAFHLIASKYAGQKFDQLVLLIRNNIATYDETGKRSFRGTARYWKWAIQRFKRMIKTGAVRFVTDSERLADEYEELTGIRFEVLPHPSLVGTSPGEPSRNDNPDRGAKSNPIQLILPGPARYEKGVDRLLEAIRELGADTELPYLQFIFQWSQPFLLPDGAELGPDDVEKFGSERITFRTIRSPLSSDDYQRLLVESDVVILPYRIEGYFSRISGVAVEAMLLGKPLLFTKNTWVDSISRQFDIGVPMDRTPSSIASAIRSSVTKLGILRETATSRQAVVAEFFSAKNFRERLLGSYKYQNCSGLETDE
jgi:glycosyltransferase involved in cell wall biosynthesis